MSRGDRRWLTFLGAGLVAVSAILYAVHFALFRDAHHIFLYLVGAIAFRRAAAGPAFPEHASLGACLRAADGVAGCSGNKRYSRNSPGMVNDVLQIQRKTTNIVAVFGASACLTLAAMHLLARWQKRTAWANVFSSLSAVGTAVFAGCELWMCGRS